MDDDPDADSLIEFYNKEFKKGKNEHDIALELVNRGYSPTQAFFIFKLVL